MFLLYSVCLCFVATVTFQSNADAFLTDGDNWGLWGGWSRCSLRCGGGVKHRSRKCIDPGTVLTGPVCPGNTTQEASCNTGLCSIPSPVFFVAQLNGNVQPHARMIQFPKVLSNVGGGLQKSGAFFVRTDGVYSFTVHACCQTQDDGVVQIRINNIPVAYTYIFDRTDYACNTITTTALLKFGDFASVLFGDPACTLVQDNTRFQTSFSGFLIN